ncbi:MarR family winged helix-turn-helix transcriptional regulator [Rhodococcus sp. H29-C3]|uniref:MarR family winged helix-turn-helix transcriptional regulator n=1 Tax=Rhodococcus sp. H29-C3 TaxID=3046307 RepID=UPI0024B9C1A2|nr:MarR family winged helix-turn-helix transcriptional regulator [Rhodococcus sp. H29-C3]MDJ0363127.1 MarR family winged helix-turn-helix transcriptional regulator [Rhodococcus sp. H29-C3]
MNQNPMQPPAKQPLGFWTARAGEAIGQHTRAALAEIGLSQPEWWVLHQLSLYPKGLDRSTMIETIGPNMGSDIETGYIETAIATVASKRWLTESESTLRLTPNGKVQFRRGADVQRALADQRMQGITDAEFATTITVLQRTIANVGGEAWHW